MSERLGRARGRRRQALCSDCFMLFGCTYPTTHQPKGMVGLVGLLQGTRFLALLQAWLGLVGSTKEPTFGEGAW